MSTPIDYERWTPLEQTWYLYESTMSTLGRYIRNRKEPPSRLFEEADERWAALCALAPEDALHERLHSTGLEARRLEASWLCEAAATLLREDISRVGVSRPLRLPSLCADRSIGVSFELSRRFPKPKKPQEEISEEK